MKIRFFKLDKNKRYNYNPRYHEEKSAGNVYELDSRIRKARTPNEDRLDVQWQKAREEGRSRKNREINTRVIIIFAILLFIALYLLDFDLSLFQKTP